ncbi:hypothetical protein OPV22_000220 [Ensete ventricosum]|uniref:DUF4005 domain-containing protein n=1 Tax=Ensete ventricosum TaxID=4639 RepID=A0AAV8RPP3_ENSVE|nr:hypothetical protein OPV22_000220 [Ensete ventricosum]
MGDPVAASRRKHRLPNGGSESSDLHAAARNGDVTSVESICNANPLAVNSRDRHSRTPLLLRSSALRHDSLGKQTRRERSQEAKKKGRNSSKIDYSSTSSSDVSSRRNASWRGVTLSDRSAEETAGATGSIEEIANESRDTGGSTCKQH